MGDHRRAMALSTTQIYVSNLPAGTTDDRLNAAFEQFGAIEDCFVPQRKRFGFVTFAAEADATKALTAMNGKSLDAAAAADASEEVIAVVAATPKPAEKEGEKKQPAAKKQPKKKKEPKAQQKKRRRRASEAAPPMLISPTSRTVALENSLLRSSLHCVPRPRALQRLQRT